MTTVIFGGAGFVGLNIVEAMLARGERVVVFDAGPLPQSAARAFAALDGELRVVEGDVTRAEAVREALAGGCRAIIYGAAVTAGVARDRDAPHLTLDVNLTGLLNVLSAARGTGVSRIINLSSAGALGRAAFAHEQLSEETPADPKSLYSITKFASERVTSRMAELWALDAVSVRLSGVFGRWERATRVRDTPSPQFQIAQEVMAGRACRLPRRDARDWIYAPDVAKAVIALRDAAELSHDLYNVSTGERWAVIDWATEFAAAAGNAGVAGEGAGVALAGEGAGEATIDFHAERDRGMLLIDRLVADTAFSPAYTMAQSAHDYARWLAEIGAQDATERPPRMA